MGWLHWHFKRQNCWQNEQNMTAKCNISPSDGWIRVGLDDGVEELDCSFRGTDLHYTSSGLLPLELKVSFNAQNKRLKSLNVLCNAKFVEVYAINDTLSKYVATVRGTNATVESAAASQNLFTMSMVDPTFDFRALQLRFLSIKPLAIESTTVSTGNTAVEFCLSSIRLEYDALPDSPAQPPLVQQGQGVPGMGMGMGGSGGGGGGGADLLALMAMSMMGMAGGGGGGVGRGGGLGGNNAMFAPPQLAPPVKGSGGADHSAGLAIGLQQEQCIDLSGGVSAVGHSAVQTGKARTASSTGSRVQAGGGDNADATDAADASIHNNDVSATQNLCSGAIVTSTNTVADNPAPVPNPVPASTPVSSTTEVPSIPTPSAARAAPVMTASRTAPAAARSQLPATTAPGIDYAQLASILWTVKGSIVDDLSQLLDKKLAPVIARLDRIDAQIEKLVASREPEQHQQHSVD